MTEPPDIISVTVADKAMEPLIPQSARLLCVRAKPENQDFVVIRFSNTGQELFRRYLVEADGSVLLKAYNKDFDSYSTNMEALASVGDLLVVVRTEYEMSSFQRFGLGERPVQAVDSVPEPSVEPITVEGIDETEFLTFEEAQMLLKVHRTKMYEILRSGELKAVKLGKLWRISRSAIREHLMARTYKGRKSRTAQENKE